MTLEHSYHTRTSEKRKTRSSFAFWLTLFGLVALALFSYLQLRQTDVVYSQTQAIESKSGPINNKIQIQGSDDTVYLSNPGLVRSGGLWALTSRTHPLPDNYVPGELVNTSLAHGDKDIPMQVQKHIEEPLRALFAAAEQDGIELMLSSAYRSIDDQHKLYDNFVAKEGTEMANMYVAAPGSSEHHTGMAVDLSTASGVCEADSDKCSLSQAAASWLHDNAARFGFIQRYPEGKQPITGVAFEPWHYRYVGVALARALSTSDLTLDEAVEQMAPGLKARD